MARILNEKKDGFPIPKDNYKMILIGFGIVIVGFLLMMGGGADSPDTFNYDIFSFRRITLAPIVVLFGFGFVFWGHAETQNEGRGEKLNINVIEY